MTETALFSELDLDPRMERAVAEMGFQAATPIQTQAIPLIRTGVDVIARSQTGTGKTVAFGIPALEAVDTEQESVVQVLILCPTRELAQQAGEEVRKLSKFIPGIHPTEVYGGADMRRQFMQLRKANMVIGTPGRVMDHMRRGTLNLAGLKMIVLDEADEMLKMGFKEDIETILQDTPETRQTVLFSATMPPPILALTKQFQKDPQTVEINKSQVTIDNIEQRLVEVPSAKKREALNLLLRYHRPNRALVFCNTKAMVDELAEYLNHRGWAAGSIHGDLKQAQRTAVMNSFKGGKLSILIATDVAARGIDVSDVDYVFNYDIPMKNEEYVHRIGRTGRAGKSGCAITLCSGKRQQFIMRNLARAVKSEIKPQSLPTPADLAAKTKARNLENMRIALAGENESFLAMVEELKAEGYTAEQIAAAALMKLFPAEPVEAVVVPKSALKAVAKREGKPEGRGERTREGKSEHKGEGSRFFGKDKKEKTTFVDLVVDVGSGSQVGPNHLVGAITEQSGISGRMIGKIDIYPEQSVVGIPDIWTEQVMETVNGSKICGKRVTVRKLAEAPKEARRAVPKRRKSKG